MTNLKEKIESLEKLGKYMQDTSEEWLSAKDLAVQRNQWFTADNIEIAVKNIVIHFLNAEKLQAWATKYPATTAPKTVGLTMAGNIPLVGFHDFLCGYLSGHRLLIKYSSKDQILLPHLIKVMQQWDAEIEQQIQASEMLKNCDAYIATGSNNSARYFEQYFARFPHIIRRNRTSVAVLDGSESKEDLANLASDIFLFFGLGCRNVTQICVPNDYDFTALFEAFEPYRNLINFHKYNNNYDYHLAVYLLNKVPYLSNDAVLLIENEMPFSAVAVVHYRYYTDKNTMIQTLQKSDDVQCVVASEAIPFGAAQTPTLSDFADGVDTMQFLTNL